jgi:hypothetical protein
MCVVCRWFLLLPGERRQSAAQLKLWRWQAVPHRPAVLLGGSTVSWLLHSDKASRVAVAGCRWSDKISIDRKSD